MDRRTLGNKALILRSGRSVKLDNYEEYKLVGSILYQSLGRSDNEVPLSETEFHQHASDFSLEDYRIKNLSNIKNKKSLPTKSRNPQSKHHPLSPAKRATSEPSSSYGTWTVLVPEVKDLSNDLVTLKIVDPQDCWEYEYDYGSYRLVSKMSDEVKPKNEGRKNEC